MLSRMLLAILAIVGQVIAELTPTPIGIIWLTELGMSQAIVLNEKTMSFGNISAAAAARRGKETGRHLILDVSSPCSQYEILLSYQLARNSLTLVQLLEDGKCRTELLGEGTQGKLNQENKKYETHFSIVAPNAVTTETRAIGKAWLSQIAERNTVVVWGLHQAESMDADLLKVADTFDVAYYRWCSKHILAAFRVDASFHPKPLMVVFNKGLCRDGLLAKASAERGNIPLSFAPVQKHLFPCENG